MACQHFHQIICKLCTFLFIRSDRHLVYIIQIELISELLLQPAFEQSTEFILYSICRAVFVYSFISWYISVLPFFIPIGRSILSLAICDHWNVSRCMLLTQGWYRPSTSMSIYKAYFIQRGHRRSHPIFHLQIYGEEATTKDAGGRAGVYDHLR